MEPKRRSTLKPLLRRCPAVLLLSLLALLLAAETVIYAGCATPKDRYSTVQGPIARTLNRSRAKAALHRPAPPEQEWNDARYWIKVGTAPDSYIPRGYSRSASRTGSAGTWFVDERDGKRLFVPAAGAGGVSEGVLRGDAIRITLWHDRHSIPGIREEPLDRFSTE